METINLIPRFDQSPVRAVFCDGGANQISECCIKIKKVNRPSGKNDAEVRKLMEEIYDTALNLVRMWYYDPSRTKTGSAD